MIYMERECEMVNEEMDLAIFKDLILKRDNLKKEERYIYLRYIQTFGNLIAKRFSLQIECIKLKKIIALCQAKENRGESSIILSLIEQDVDAELNEYYQELQTICELSKKDSKSISEYEYMMIKKKYKCIAMRIHPDLHREYANDTELMDLWEEVKYAYKRNDLVALEDVEFLIYEYLKTHGESVDIDIHNLTEKIKKVENEIEWIVSNDPYRYKFILDDKIAIKEKQREYEEDIEEYQAYLVELTEKLSTFNFTKELLS